MNQISQEIRQFNVLNHLHISVICLESKIFYLKNPKMVQRLPKEERAYWYWFLKNH